MPGGPMGGEEVTADWWLGVSIPLVTISGGPGGDTSPGQCLRVINKHLIWFQSIQSMIIVDKTTFEVVYHLSLFCIYFVNICCFQVDLLLYLSFLLVYTFDLLLSHFLHISIVYFVTLLSCFFAVFVMLLPFFKVFKILFERQKKM